MARVGRSLVLRAVVAGRHRLTALLALTILVALFAVLVDPAGGAAHGGAILGGVVAHLLPGGAGGWAGTRLSRPRGADDGSLPRRGPVGSDHRGTVGWHRLRGTSWRARRSGSA
jgi:hypothetical protein